MYHIMRFLVARNDILYYQDRSLPILLDFRFELKNPSIMATVESTSAVAEAPKTVVLKSCDGEEFEVESTVANQSEMIKGMIDDGCVQSAVHLPNVVGSVLARVVEYWNRHGSGKEEEEEKRLMEWDKEFVKKLDRDEMFELIHAANFLNSKPLLDLCCQTVADTIKDTSVEEVRDYFGIESDFTPEEEARIRDGDPDDRNLPRPKRPSRRTRTPIWLDDYETYFID